MTDNLENRQLRQLIREEVANGQNGTEGRIKDAINELRDESRLARHELRARVDKLAEDQADMRAALDIHIISDDVNGLPTIIKTMGRRIIAISVVSLASLVIVVGVVADWDMTFLWEQARNMPREVALALIAGLAAYLGISLPDPALRAVRRYFGSFKS